LLPFFNEVAGKQNVHPLGYNPLFSGYWYYFTSLLQGLIAGSYPRFISFQPVKALKGTFKA